MTEAAFLTPLRTEKLGAHRWLLIDDLLFSSSLLNGVFCVTRGFQTDMCSVPLWLGTLLPRVGAFDSASVLHDAGYAGALQTIDRARIWLTKAWTDRLFFEALRASEIGQWRASVMYYAVHYFGDQVKHPLAAHGTPA
jgi:hypothetical protein